MLERTKYVRSLGIFLRNNEDFNVDNPTVADSAFRAFDRKTEITIEDEEGKVFIPYHAVDYVETNVTQEVEEVEDDTCNADCDIMEDPTLTVPTEPIEAIAGEEFDPLEGVSALDTFKHRLNVTAELDTSLLNEDGENITDENSDNLIAG